jgi:hypothetical protein
MRKTIRPPTNAVKQEPWTHMPHPMTTGQMVHLYSGFLLLRGIRLPS